MRENKKRPKGIESLIDPTDPGHSGADNFRSVKAKESVSGGKWRLTHPVYNRGDFSDANNIGAVCIGSYRTNNQGRADNRLRMRAETRIERGRRISLA